MRTKRLSQVYTGRGKGKTTAAVGLAVRAAANGLKVCWICFFKDPDRRKYGEHRALKKLGIDMFAFAKKHPRFHKGANRDKIRQECLKALEFVKKIYKENIYDILVLDEILISLRDGFLKEKEILEILDLKPEKLELVLTGRGATKKIIEKADLVSMVKKIKHPYDMGIQSRKGIEY